MQGSLVELITALGIGAALPALIGWLKDRRKVSSEVKLTDMETLQKQLTVLEGVIHGVEAENKRLRANQVEYEERDARRIARIRELEGEVDTLRRNVHTLEYTSARLSRKLAEFINTEGEQTT